MSYDNRRVIDRTSLKSRVPGEYPFDRDWYKKIVLDAVDNQGIEYDSDNKEHLNLIEMIVDATLLRDKMRQVRVPDDMYNSVAFRKAGERSIQDMTYTIDSMYEYLETFTQM